MTERGFCADEIEAAVNELLGAGLIEVAFIDVAPTRPSLLAYVAA